MPSKIVRTYALLSILNRLLAETENGPLSVTAIEPYEDNRLDHVPAHDVQDNALRAFVTAFSILDQVSIPGVDPSWRKVNNLLQQARDHALICSQVDADPDNKPENSRRRRLRWLLVLKDLDKAILIAEQEPTLRVADLIPKPRKTKA